MPTSYKFNYSEIIELAYELDCHHSVFDKIWQLGKPTINEDIQTAQVEFNKDGNFMTFAINPTFWNSLSKHQKAFVISHECLHIILSHGLRMIDNYEDPAINITMDIVVNHMLVNYFNFERHLVDPNNKLIWIDNTFKPEDNIQENKCFEYYYSKIKKLRKEILQDLFKNGLLDSHGQSQDSQSNSQPDGQSDSKSESNPTESDIKSIQDEIFEYLNKEMTPEAKEDLKDKLDGSEKNKSTQAGTMPGSSWIIVNVSHVKKKRKWETVIKNWALKQLKDASKEQWAKTNRRYATLSGDLLLPTEAETEGYEDQKIQVWFFQDTSGSCSHLAERFFKAAKSLPTDRFDVKLHCFDTKVYETELTTGILYGSGGTSFTCIENYIINYINNNKQKYPLAIFVITDGYGNKVRPKKPKNWYWFLSTNYKAYIPTESNIFELKDYE